MLTFFDFPKEHWAHLRTNQHRGVALPARAAVHRRLAALQEEVENAEAMIWRLMTVAEQPWRKFNAPGLLKDVYAGQHFKAGVAVKSKTDASKKAA